MPEIFFSSDHHFGHKNIMKYESVSRPFESLDEMHEVMIERWNHMVSKRDTVFYLGDFAFGQKNIAIAERLNGKKKLILGNHDKYPVAEYAKYFEKIYGVLFWERCIISHVPCHPNGIGERWKLNVHGHLHSKKVRRNIYDIMEMQTDQGSVQFSKLFCEEEDPHYLNVSVEQNNLTPIHADVIRQRFKEL